MPFKKGFTPWNKNTGIRLEKKQCENCGVIFISKYRVTRKYWDKRRFCSEVCMGISMKGKLPKNHEALCKMSRTEATKQKMSEAQSGEKSFRWNPDRSAVTHNRRNDGEYLQWRKKVYLRDNFKCKIADADCSGRIEAHHVLGWAEYVELRYEVNNGITLCQVHHPLKRAEEKRLIPYFMGLVPVSN